MAQFPKVNPNPDGNAVVTGLRPLQFFEIDANANLQASTGPNGGLAELITVIEQRSTIEILGQVGTIILLGNNGNTSSAGGGIRVALADIGTWGIDNANSVINMQAAIRAVGNYTIGNSTVGFANINFSNSNVYTFVF
jgi:hypothetical protein